jgi:hypothetical protein
VRKQHSESKNDVRQIIEQVSEFKYLGYFIPDHRRDMETKLMPLRNISVTKIKIHIRAKATFEYGSEAWVFQKVGTGKLETVQMRFIQLLLDFIRLDHQRNTDIQEN